MTISQQILRGVTAIAILAGATSAARAEIIPAARMANGVSMTQQQCAAQASAVWVVVARQGYCIRYYLSTAGGQGQTPVVFLSGDKLGRYDSEQKTFKQLDGEDIDTDKLQKSIDKVSVQTGTTAIHLGRPGIDGSSGFHGFRRSWLELYIVHTALEEIKRKHAFAGYHLFGQSGGAGLIGGLLILREDIACAVAGAGRLAQLTDKPQKGERLLQYFDPIREVRLIATRRGTRVIVVTDPQDKRVKVENQTTFANALHRAGGRVEQYYVQATDDLRHGVKVYSVRAIVGCVKGETRQQIAAALSELQQRVLVAAHEGKRPGRAGRGQPAPPQPAQGQQPVPAQPPAAPAKQYAGRIQPIPLAQQGPQAGKPAVPQQQASRIQRPS